MSLRWPKLSARPKVFTLNPESPFYRPAQFLGLGSAPYTTRYTDSSVHRNHGTLTGYVGAGDTPSEKWAWDSYLRRFVLGADGTNDYVLGGLVNLVNDHTISYWINFNTISIGATWAASVAKGHYNSSGNYLQLWQTGGTNVRQYRNASYVSWNPALTASGWARFDFVMSHGVATAYKDGVPLGVGQALASGNDVNTFAMCLGATTTPQYYLPAKMSDVLLFSGDQSWAIPYLADPSNVDLRVGGVPLILSVRQWWPSAVAKEGRVCIGSTLINARERIGSSLISAG